ncbi:MAG: putative nucleotidyltransferase [Candidatus Saganbacteria bacterium]|uniref:Putative nucleotidyltransferase n=1 Tax=Candidatus Saganbacteria bacterium TaxID=2575572 RepID=A0A833L0C9_UNCSA|nr:MAG: putative nucleotidyltransferase [Candidatus Saganbacteria bacterium]
MLKTLFSSKARVKVLTLFMENPKNRYYLREIEKIINILPQALQRELAKLKNIGLLSETAEGNRIYYQINSKHLIYPELKSLINKTTGLQGALKRAFSKEKEIERAFIYGSLADGRETVKSDIDLFIIGTISGKKLQTILRKSSLIHGRETNTVIYTPKEFKEKKKNHFIRSVIKENKIILKGDLNGF